MAPGLYPGRGGNRDLTLCLALPTTPGTVALSAVVHTSQAPGGSNDVSLLLPLEVVSPPPLADVRLQLVPLLPRHGAYRQADEALRRAEQALDRQAADKALQEMLKAAAALQHCRMPEAAEVRLALAEALRGIAQHVP